MLDLHPLPRRTVLAGAALPLLAGCRDRASQHRLVRIATGSPTAVYYIVGTALAGLIGRRLPGTDAHVLVTAASAENIQLIATTRAELGFSQADVLVRGSAQAPVALARIYDDLLHLVVRADGPVRTLKDLKGRRVSVGGRGSGTGITVERLLAVARMSGAGFVDRRELGLDDSLWALARKGIDAFFFSGGLPVTGIARLAAEAPIRVVDLSSWAGDLRRAYSEVYVVRDVPASAYRLPAVATIAVPNLLVASASMPEDLGYDLTRLLMEGRDVLAAAHPAAERLDIRSAIATMPVPLHPGAARYYRSVKP
jgi:hypothetical protein